EYWNNGYCTEAVRSVVKYAFEVMLLNKVHAYFLCRNKASGNVLFKNKFIKEGMFRQHVKYKNNFEDIECCGLLKADHINTLL
ncbi:MAG: GNAT family N-acetyltransferase, partial [Bacteroidetes bacterium]|nr:GNAT family N-acetyltransferase [Bacteroidota bacterium]